MAQGRGFTQELGTCGGLMGAGAGDVWVVCLAAGAGDMWWTHRCRSWKTCGLSRWVRVLDGKGHVTVMTNIVTQGLLGLETCGGLVSAGLAADMQVYVCVIVVCSCSVNMKTSDRRVGRRSDRPSEGGGKCHPYQNLEGPCGGHQLKRYTGVYRMQGVQVLHEECATAD